MYQKIVIFTSDGGLSHGEGGAKDLGAKVAGAVFAARRWAADVAAGIVSAAAKLAKRKKCAY